MRAAKRGIVPPSLTHAGQGDFRQRGGLASRRAFGSAAEPFAMRLLVQRVSHASVVVDNQVVGAIDHGFLGLVGIGPEDGAEDIEWLAGKLVGLRVFPDDEGLMNRSVREVDGGILLVSQFTLFASTRKGNRPGFSAAARPEVAQPLFEQFVARVTTELGKPVPTGVFGADMKISLTNDGPVTLWIDSRARE